MANELQCRTGASGQSPYALIESMTGTIWNGSALVSYVAADIGNYDVALSERGSTGRYYGDMPALTAGRYRVRYFVPAVAGTPTEYDQFVGEDVADWDGSAVVGVGTERDVNVSRVNDVAISGDGSSGNRFRGN